MLCAHSKIVIVFSPRSCNVTRVLYLLVYMNLTIQLFHFQPIEVDYLQLRQVSRACFYCCGKSLIRLTYRFFIPFDLSCSSAICMHTLHNIHGIGKFAIGIE